MFQGSVLDGHYSLRFDATRRVVFALVADKNQRPPLYKAVKRVENLSGSSWRLLFDDTVWKTTDRAEATRKWKALVSTLGRTGGAVRTEEYPA